MFDTILGIVAIFVSIYLIQTDTYNQYKHYFRYGGLKDSEWHILRAINLSDSSTITLTHDIPSIIVLESKGGIKAANIPYTYYSTSCLRLECRELLKQMTTTEYMLTLHGRKFIEKHKKKLAKWEPGWKGEFMEWCAKDIEPKSIFWDRIKEESHRRTKPHSLHGQFVGLSKIADQEVNVVVIEYPNPIKLIDDKDIIASGIIPSQMKIKKGCILYFETITKPIHINSYIQVNSAIHNNLSVYRINFESIDIHSENENNNLDLALWQT